MASTRSSGLSMLEIVAAAVILAAASTTAVAFIAPMHDRSLRNLDRERIAELNGIVARFHEEEGDWPDKRLHELVAKAYCAPHARGYPYLRTPLGSIYLFDRETKKVYNPIIRREQYKP